MYEGQVCAPIILPTFFEPILWEVEFLLLVDDVGNMAIHQGSSLSKQNPRLLLTYGYNATELIEIAPSENDPDGDDDDDGLFF